MASSQPSPCASRRALIALLALSLAAMFIVPQAAAQAPAMPATLPAPLTGESAGTPQNTRPANDDFANRIRVNSTRTFRTTNIGATRETGEPLVNLSTVYNTSVWWEFMPAADGWLVVDTHGTDFGHYLSLYSGNQLNALRQLESRNGFGGSRNVEFEMPVERGVPIQIMVTGGLGPTGAQTGNIVLNIQSFTERGETTATLTATRASGARRAFASFQVTITAESGAVNAISSWRANGEEFGTDRIRGYLSRGTSDLPVGVNRITLHYPGNRETEATVSNTVLYTVEGPPAQPNDDFEARTRITRPGTFQGDTTGATYQVGEPMILGRRRHYTVWYSYTPPENGQLTIDTVGSSFDTVLAVYTGSRLDRLTLVAENDNLETQNSRSRVSFAATAGTAYQIALSSGWTGTYRGPYTLNLALTTTGPVPTTTSLFGPLTGLPGTPLTFRGRVSSGAGIPGGTVSFRRDGTQFGTGVLNASGEATTTISTLPLGNYQITAHYLGAAGFAASASAPQPLAIANPPQANYVGGGALFGQTAACDRLFGLQPQAVAVRYSPSEMGGLPSGVTIAWPDGSEHVTLWGPMEPSGANFLGGSGRQSWTRFLFYPTRPLVRVVQRQITEPVGAVITSSRELVLRLRVQGFGAIPACAITLAATVRRE